MNSGSEQLNYCEVTQIAAIELRRRKLSVKSVVVKCVTVILSVIISTTTVVCSGGVSEQAIGTSDSKGFPIRDGEIQEIVDSLERIDITLLNGWQHRYSDTDSSRYTMWYRYKTVYGKYAIHRDTTVALPFPVSWITDTVRLLAESGSVICSQTTPHSDVTFMSQYVQFAGRCLNVIDGLSLYSEAQCPIRLFPNPSSGDFVHIESAIALIQPIIIYSAIGESVLSVPEFGTVNIGSLATGTYYARIISSTGTEIRRLIVTE